MWKSDRKTRESAGKVDRIVGTESSPAKMENGQVIINKKATKQNLQKLKAINEDGLSKKQTGKTTTDGTDGGLLKGKPHYDENGKPTGGIPVVVDNSRNIEVEGEEFVVNAEASKKHWQELSKINQSTGNGVPIGPPNGAVDEDPEEYDKGGKIQFNPNHVPNKWILQFAEKVRTEHPKVWDLGGNIFGNEAYKNLKRVAERGYWLDSEEWMYIKWQSYIARHKKDFRIAGVIAMLKWVDKVDRGWAYMKDLIQERIKKEEAKKGWKHKMKGGGTVAQTPAPKPDRIKGSDVNKPDSSESTKSGSSIKFDEQTLTTISNKVKEHNDKHPDKKITIGAAKAVVRRGMGAYSSSHRPTIKGGKPNSRTAWGIARLNAFIYKILKGKSKSGKYTQDDDLIEELGYSVSKYHLGGDMSKHLAPNGKPSNLTHEQWHLVRTPKFKAWFGDWEHDPANSSKVVDENGEPLVMYHGSPSNFTVFETDIIESDRDDRDFKPRFWFIVDKNWAYNYSKSIPTPTQKTYEVFLNIRNPKYDFNLYVEDNNDGSIEVRGKKVWVAIATLSNQIKLADGSNTTFDTENPDIRFDEGGNTDYAELYQVYVLDHNEPVKVFETYNMNEAKSVLNHQKSLGRKGAHIQYSFKDGGVTDSRDSVTLDIPLLIRTLELAREDIKSDADLHRVVENLIKLKNKRVLTMDDYNYIAHIKKHTEKMKQGGTTQAQREKIAKVMHEYKSGNLHSGSKQGPIVTDRDQAIAIALSEANASKYAPGGNVEPIRTLGNGSPVYFETDYLRLNERYNKPGYLLLVNKAGDKDGVPNWELVFDDLNEAVYVANKLNTIYPNGVFEAVWLHKFVDTLKKERNTNESSIQVILNAIKDEVSDDYFNTENGEQQVRKEIWDVINNPKFPYLIDNEKQKREVWETAFTAWLNIQRQKDSRFDETRPDEIKRIIELNPKLFIEKFSLKSYYIDDNTRLHLTFKNGDSVVIDLFLDAVYEQYGRSKSSNWDRTQDIKIWLQNARQFIDTNPIVIIYNFSTRSKEFNVRPKLLTDDYKPTTTSQTPTKNGFSQKLYRGISEYKNVTYGGRTDEGLGDFWTNNRTMAEWFAGVTDYNVNTGKYEPTGGNGKVLEQVIELKNPYIIDSSHPKYDIDNEHTSWNIMMDEMNARTKEQVQQYVTKLIQKGYDGIIMKDNTTNYYDDGTYDIVVRFTEEQFKNAGVTMNNTISTNVTDYKNPYEVNRAIEKLLESKGTDRDEYTPDEIKFISYYSGYGGLEKLGSFSDEELKGLLYEFFTPDEVVRKMWGLAYKYGYGTIADNSVFEPSVGVGAFLKYAPEDVPVVANEINPVSAKITSILYPEAHVILQPFEKNFIKSNLSIKSKIDDLQKYSLVIGNPPYGMLKSKFISMGEGDYSMAGNWIEYFITRGLDLLHPGGLLIYIVGAEQFNGGTLFLDSPISKVKRAIFDKAELLDAYRLPRNVFERTGVSSEIIVLKKK